MLLHEATDKRPFSSSKQSFLGTTHRVHQCFGARQRTFDRVSCSRSSTYVPIFFLRKLQVIVEEQKNHADDIPVVQRSFSRTNVPSTSSTFVLVHERPILFRIRIIFRLKFRIKFRLKYFGLNFCLYLGLNFGLYLGLNI